MSLRSARSEYDEEVGVIRRLCVYEEIFACETDRRRTENLRTKDILCDH